MRIAFSWAPVQALGPGIRFGLWFQGCSRGCPGCMSPEYQPFYNSGCRNVDPGELANEIIATCKRLSCRGITISGGEPFEQPEDLRQLCKRLKVGGIKDILIYSGFKISELLKLYSWIPYLVSCVIDGPFVNTLPSNSICKGSANQQVILFDNIPNYINWLCEQKGPLQIVEASESVHIIGIPRIGDSDILLRRTTWRS